MFFHVLGKLRGGDGALGGVASHCAGLQLRLSFELIATH
jgi:hypothetical protein